MKFLASFSQLSLVKTEVAAFLFPQDDRQIAGNIQTEMLVCIGESD